MQSRNANQITTKTVEDKKRSKERMRHPFVYIFTFIILIIIVVTFVGGPLMRGMSGRSTIIFGSWGKQEIEFVPGNYLARQRDILYDQLRESGTEESYEWQAYRVWKGAYDRTVVHTALMVIAERSHLYISDDRIDQVLLTSGPYMDNGVFSEERYNNTSNADKYRYRSLVREDLTQSQYITDLNRDSLRSPAAAAFLKDLATEERSFSMIQRTYEEYPDSEVVLFGNGEAKLFRKVKLSRITVRSGEQDSETIRKQILDGTSTFEDQAKNYSTDGFAEKGGEMGWREYQSLRADFGSDDQLDELFALQPNELSGVYEAGFGWVFYRIDEPVVEPDFADDETVDSVRSYMKRFERGRIEDFLLAQAAAFRSDAIESGFSVSAQNLSYEVFRTNYFPLNFGDSFFMSTPQIENSETNFLDGAGYSEQFFTALFGLDVGEISEPLILDEAIAVFLLEDIREASPDDVAFLETYYPFIAQQYLDQDLNDFIFSSGEYEDNFAGVFSELFLTQ